MADPITLIPSIVRGIFDIPAAVRQQGAVGVPNAFLNPGSIEREERARTTIKGFEREEQMIDQIMQTAQSPEELRPAFDLLAQIEHSAARSGAIQDEGSYNRIIKPIAAKVVTGARRLMQQAAPEEMARFGVAEGSPEIVKGGSVLQTFEKNRRDIEQTGAETEKTKAETGKTQAMTTTEDTLRQPRANLLESQADYYGGGGGGSRRRTSPKLSDLHRVGRDLDKATQPALPDLPAPAPSDAMVAEYNRMAGPLGRPPLMYDPGPNSGIGGGMRELTGGAQNVARTLGAVPEAPPLLEEQAPALGPLPQPRKIEIPAQFRTRALSDDPRQALSTSEVVAYYRQQGMDETAARAAARQAIMELGGAAQR